MQRTTTKRNGRTTIETLNMHGQLHSENGPALRVLDEQGNPLKEEYHTNGALYKRVFYYPHSGRIWEVGEHKEGRWIVHRAAL